MIAHPSGDRHWTRAQPERVKRGTESHAAKLSREQIEDIGYWFEQGANQSWIARKFGVSRVTVWRHLKALGL
jgi:DNA invertase Pin-like site-specific DNA recombinase